MTFKADIVGVDNVQAPQIGQASRTTKAIGKGWRIGIAMPGLIERQHDIAATGEFDGEAVLCLAAVEIAVYRQDGGRLVLGADEIC